MSIIKGHMISKSKDGKEILSNINLHIDQGEIVGLIGGNGVGKTTLLKTLVGLYEPDKGEIIRKNISYIGYIMEKPNFYEYMTAYQNLKIFSRLVGSPIEEIDQLLNTVDLIEYKHTTVKKYSFGMKQRLGIARALLNNPKLLLLDEPTNGLDPQGVILLRNLLLNLCKQGTTTVLSSHALKEIETLCSRVYLMKDRNLIELDKNKIEDKRTVCIEFDNIYDIVSTLKEFPNRDMICSIEKVKSNFIKIEVDFSLNIGLINTYLVERGYVIYQIYIDKPSQLENSYMNLTMNGS